MKRVVILLAHGSRDRGWRRPIERLARSLRRSGEAQFAVAYLENTAPDLETLIARFAKRGCRSLTVVPVFLGSGRHLKQDLAHKVRALRRVHRDLHISVQRAIGEQPRVIAAIARAILGE